MKRKLRISFGSRVTLILIAAMFLVTLLGMVTDGKSNALFSVYRTSWLDPFQYMRLVTHILGHVNIEHFFNNALMILVLGPLIEEKYGSGPFAMMIFITALVTGFISMLIFPNVALLGASGIVFMLILLSSFAYFDGESIPATFLLVLVLYLGREVWAGITTQDQTSQFGHIVGGLCGSVFGFMMGKRTHKKDAVKIVHTKTP